MLHDFFGRFLRRKRCLAIIGNGFDLAHGLKTGYADFIAAQSADAFDEYRAFLEKYCAGAERWCDFEMCINDLTYNCFFRSISGDFDSVAESDAESINEMFDRLRRRLADYLYGETVNAEITKLHTVKRALRGNIPAISFNYTATAELYTKNVFYVHGSLKENEIVLGYDFRYEPCLMDPELMLWSKALCRERLDYFRFLRARAVDDAVLRECMRDMVEMQRFKNSGKGFEASDFDTLSHPDAMKAFYSGNPYAYSKAFPSDLSHVREIIVLGHSLSADEHYLQDILSRCKRLRRVIIFTRSGKTDSSFAAKREFFLPYCRKVEVMAYR